MTVAGWQNTTMSDTCIDTSQVLSAIANVVLLFLGQLAERTMM